MSAVTRPWYDTHVHLERYPEAERLVLLERAGEASVEILAVSVDMESSRAVVAMPGAWGRAVGVHPKHADSVEPSLGDLATGPGVVAIGECGFDAEGPGWDAQEAAFREQCRMARELNLALVLHIDGAGAWERLVAGESALEGLRVVRHYFQGDAAEARWHSERGHYLSFGNPLRRRAELRDIAREYPPDRLLIETDSYPLPGRNTEPAHVGVIGETLALLSGWTFDEARERLEANTFRAFGREGGPGYLSKSYAMP